MSEPNDPGKKPRGEPGRSLRLKVAFEGKPDRPLDVAAFAFDAGGKLLASAPVKAGQVELALTNRQARGTRIFFASLPEGTENVTLETMARARAYEPAWQFDPRRQAVELRPIPEGLWTVWRWCRCRVRGRVVKPVDVHGVIHDKPVCNARVHVCEVDRLLWIIPRLPDLIIDRLRAELLEAIPRPWPFPEPDSPIFRFDPRVIDPSPVQIARMNKLNPQPEPPSRAGLSPARLRSRGEEVQLNPQPLPPRAALAELSVETRAALSSPSLTVVRRALVDNLAILRPWICGWPWIWPYFCRCDEIDVVITDDQGRFETEVWYLCSGDHPDLYFWVEYCIGGIWTTISRPHVCCNTYWNYACGSEVTLTVTDPRVPWCGDDAVLPGKQVAVLSIGNGVSTTEIQRSAAGASEGLTTTAPHAEPFGGSLEPHVWFGDGLIPSGITHYRWSYRRLGSSGEWPAMDKEVVRHYGETLADSTLTFKPFPLGPDPAFAGENLFKIRPDDPPLNPGAVSASWAPEVDGRSNTASAYFLSHLLEGGNAATAAGKYELKLELFKNDGSLVNLTDEGVLLKVPTVDAPFGVAEVPTQLVAHFPAVPGDMEDRVIRDGAGKIVAFRIVLHVDNNPCDAEINEVEVNDNAAGPCGFIPYTPGSEAVVSFKARHPNDFATFSFGVFKGSCGQVAEASADGSVAGPVVDGFTRDAASVFTKDVPVATLLAGGPCGTVCVKAAFAETLHVDALATDGWSTLDYLDADGVPKAFALEPA
jgi:hypothetical protein